MAKLLKIINPDVTAYKDRRFDGNQTQWERAIVTSTTVYVGNLSFYTREEQIYDVFSRVGHIKRVIMGLDKKQKTPCGFCFVSYYTRAEAEACIRYLNGTTLDDRPIRVDHDWGFVDGRQWGRGLSGGQVRDEFRQDYDPGRGGYGKIMQSQMEEGLGDEEEALGDEAQAYGGFGGIMQTGTPAGQGDAKRRRMHSGMGVSRQGGEQAQVREEPVNPRFKDRDSDDERAA